MRLSQYSNKHQHNVDKKVSNQISLKQNKNKNKVWNDRILLILKTLHKFVTCTTLLSNFTCASYFHFHFLFLLFIQANRGAIYRVHEDTKLCYNPNKKTMQ